MEIQRYSQKKKGQKCKQFYKTLHRKLEIDQHQPH